MRKHGYNTGRREVIKNFMRLRADENFTAENICAQLAGKGVSRSTVYRQLEALTAGGELRKFPSEDSGAFVYQFAGLSDECDHHVHLKCDVCGKLIHLSCEEIRSHIKIDHDFILDCRKTVLYGVCGGCRVKKT